MKRNAFSQPDQPAGEAAAGFGGLPTSTAAPNLFAGGAPAAGFGAGPTAQLPHQGARNAFAGSVQAAGNPVLVAAPNVFPSVASATGFGAGAAAPEPNVGSRNAFAGGVQAAGNSAVVGNAFSQVGRQDTVSHKRHVVKASTWTRPDASPAEVSASGAKREETVASQWVRKEPPARSFQGDGPAPSRASRLTSNTPDRSLSPDVKRPRSPARMPEPASEPVDVHEAMQSGAMARRQRAAEVKVQRQQADIEEHEARLQNVDDATRAAVCSEDELRKTCAALEVGSLAASTGGATPLVPHVFESVQTDDLDWEELVRSLSLQLIELGLVLASDKGASCGHTMMSTFGSRQHDAQRPAEPVGASLVSWRVASPAPTAKPE